MTPTHKAREELVKNAAMDAVIGLGSLDFRLALALAHGNDESLRAASATVNAVAAKLRAALADLDATAKVEVAA